MCPQELLGLKAEKNKGNIAYFLPPLASPPQFSVLCFLLCPLSTLTSTCTHCFVTARPATKGQLLPNRRLEMRNLETLATCCSRFLLYIDIEEFVEKMLEDLEDLTSPEEFKLPKEYSWPEKKLKVSILPDVVFDSPLH